MATDTTHPTDRWLELLKRRYNTWCDWCRKIETYRISGQTLPYPKGRPSKKSKYGAYRACQILRKAHDIQVDEKDLGLVREWRAVLVAMGVKNVKPLPKCNEMASYKTRGPGS